MRWEATPLLCSAAARWRPLRCGLVRPPLNLDGIERDFRTRPLDAGPYTVAAADALTTKVREGGQVNVRTSVAIGVNVLPARDHRFQSVPSRSARVASMAMAASGRSSSMA